MKFAVFCVLTVSVTGLMVMLIQGCKREQPPTDTSDNTTTDTNTSMADTNLMPLEASNPPVPMPSNQPPAMATLPSPNLPAQPPTGTVPPLPNSAMPAPEAGGADYVVVKSDTLARIAKKNGVTLKALEAANPSIQPTKLKVGMKLSLPAGAAAPAGSSAVTAPGAVADTGSSEEVYVVKSGDTLTKIAKAHGLKVKALEAANGLSTTKIKVGQKLKIPAKAEPAAPVPAPVPVETTAPPVTAPVPTVPAAPAPGQTH